MQHEENKKCSTCGDDWIPSLFGYKGKESDSCPVCRINARRQKQQEKAKNQMLKTTVDFYEEKQEPTKYGNGRCQKCYAKIKSGILCPRCNPKKPVILKCSLCGEKLDTSLYSKKKYGIMCPSCQIKERIKNCAERKIERQKKKKIQVLMSTRNRRTKCKESGICQSCRVRPSEPERTQCAACLRRQREYAASFKRFWVEQFGEKCYRCSGSFPDAVYDFHHKNPAEKKHGINTLIKSKNSEIIVEEMKKCVMLCANCHRIVHANAEVLRYD